MDEQRLQDILGQKLEVPDMVNKKLQETYTQLEGKRRPKRRGLGAVRTAVIAAVLAAALCVSATAAYQIFRQEVPVDKDEIIQGVSDGNRMPWERQEVRNEYGVIEAYWPNRDTADMDAAQAQALLGDYLPECGYQWQIEDYTLTVEGYVLDEQIGAGRFYYSIEHPGGFPEGSVDREHGILSYLSHISVMFGVKTGGDELYLNNKMQFVDLERSTDEKLYLTAGSASMGDWKAEDGMVISFRVKGETPEDGDVLSAELEMPGLKSLPAVSVTDPAAGASVGKLSPIALMLNTGANMDEVGYIALDYADGTRYVVRDDANSLDNTDYGLLGNDFLDMRLCFNRLVDPSQVAAVIVDGQRYEVN